MARTDTSTNLSASFFKFAKRAMSMANAIRMSSAARNENPDDRSVNIVRVENERTNATKMTAVAEFMLE